MKRLHCWTIVTLLSVTFATRAFTQETPELVLGVPVSQAISGGTAQTYRIKIGAGQFVKLLLEQQSVDLAVKILHPDGRLLVAGDIAHGPQGRERLAVITDSEGIYRVEVHSLEKDTSHGRYELRVQELHLAGSEDRSFIAGQVAYAEGEQARLQKPANRPEAIKKYEEALGLFRSAADRSGAAAALTNIGVVYNVSGERQKALEYLNQALALHQLMGDHREQARTLNYMGFAASGLVERQKALDYFKQSLALSQAINDAQGEASTLEYIGGIYGAMGEPQKSLDYYDLAVVKSKALGDLSLQVRALTNIGAVHNSLGDVPRALQYFNEVLPLYRTVRDTYGEGLTLVNMGSAYIALRDWPKALECFNRALPLAKTQDDRRWLEAMVRTNIGNTQNSLGNSQESLAYLNEALTIHKDVKNRQWEAHTLASLGTTYESMGQPERALDYFNQALTLSRAIANHNAQATILWKIARIERDRGNLAEARRRTETALDIVESLRTRVVSQESRASFFASRRGFYEFYIDLLMKLDQQNPAKGHDAEALQTSELARARGLLETLAEARVDIREGVDAQLLERERALQRQLNDEELQRVRLLRRKHTQADLETIDKRVKQLLEDYNRVQSEIRARSPRYAALVHPLPLSLREIQEQVLDDKTMLLEYTLGEERSYLWVVTQSELKSFVLPKRSVIEAAARRVYELLMVSNKTQARRPAELALADLGRLILGPAANLLSKERLIIVADGALEYVPFTSLPVTSGAYEPLIARHEIVNLPSASVLVALRREKSNRPTPPEALAVLADAVFQSDDPRLGKGQAPSVGTGNHVTVQSELLRSAGDVGVLNFPRLPFSRQEAEAIVAKAGAPRSLKALDFTASRETIFNAKLDQYRIIHFATHGLLNSQHPKLSGIVLSLFDEQGRPIDGFLRAHEIYNLKLNAELVVLSACRTALGKEIKGEGLVGLTRGFMYAGTPSVVASVWDVRDQATSELMSRFYERMFKDRLRPAAALRAAQVSMWKEKRWAAPYYWAGFTIQGEWQ
jgi:CHAT domain-containing protein/Tfp pilus assembly protein PilF